MGFILNDDIRSQHDQPSDSADAVLKDQPNGTSVRSFKVLGLISDQVSTPTCMKEEIVLLSWLIVLLRTREDGRASYEWAYQSHGDVSNTEVAFQLSTADVLPKLQNSVGDTLASISRHIENVKENLRPAEPSSTSLLLSTGSLSESADSPKDDNLLKIEVSMVNGDLNISPVWHSEKWLPYTITRHIESLVDTIEMCISSPERSIENCLSATTHDLNTIWSWNHELPPAYDFCMHEMISERAREFPDKEAISSWDGGLTYSEVDRYSTKLASTLRKAGVALHDFIPVCFEKSRWTIVAVLAVMKAGGTIVLMDPTLPLARLQNMAKQVDAKTMVSSETQQELAASILPAGERFVVKEDTFSHMSASPVLPGLPPVPADALMYIIFTSGSTGTPKGVKISHKTYTSSAIPRAKAVGYKPSSRVLDFASYAFDVSIDSMLLTLGNGGCLCIPSDEDRLNDINKVIRKMRINYAGITPSMARILDPDVIKSLDILGLGGEAASGRDVNVWGQDTRIVIGYGPCECTIGCTINSNAATGRDYISIGHGNGAAMWIVDPDNHEVLMPVGAVGELLVEGPIVGQGYLNDPDKTAAAFIYDPSWLVAGHKGYAGRKGRLYKTGDLGVYDPDGSGGIVFVGRKDTQVKLRGQRVELGEIESQLNARLPSDTTVIAEVIVPQGAGGQSALVAFVSFQPAKGQECLELHLAELTGDQSQLLSDSNKEVSKVLPRYMVPTAYIPVNYIPKLISGKTDRKRLRQFGNTVDLRELDQHAGNAVSRALSELEQRLRQVWSAVLKLNPENIRLEDNFFALGGDSLAAMRLVSICREQGLDLSVTSTFGNPTLSAMTEVVKLCNDDTRAEVAPFSMISQAVESACLEASQACGVGRDAVEDIYPATPTQESLFTFSVKSVKAYVAQRVACVPAHVTVDTLKKAWEDVVQASPILRSRLVQLQDPGLQQVVLKVGVDWKHSVNLDQYLEEDRNEKMHLGQSLARYAIVDNAVDGKRYMVWTVHHVLYDGWSEPVILDKVRNSLAGQKIEMPAHMKDFVKFVRDTDDVAMHDFWQQELNGAVSPQFPRLPYRDYLPTPNGMVERIIPFEAGAGSPFTLATFIRGAWALVASQYTRSDDVVFGETLTGRDISLPGVEGIVGPLIATVPIRIHVCRNSTVESYLQAVQQAILARTPYQHMGMQNIRKVSRDAQHACEAGTGLVVQPEPEYEGSDLGFSQGDVVREALHFNPYPLMLGCGIRKGGFRVCASFDSRLVGVSQMERILAQLEVTCSELAKNLSRKVEQISCLPEEELTQIWRRNQIAPLSRDVSSGKLRADEGVTQGSAYPPSVVHWVCDPRNPSLLSPIGCPGELWLEGACLSEKTVESPAWLVAGCSEIPGRSGNVQPTGDIVQQQEDGSLVFVGRKDNIVPVQGHAVDIADLEMHFSRYLPSTTRAAAAVFQLSQNESKHTSELQLTVFVESQPSEGEYVELMAEKHEVAWNSSDPRSLKTSVCASAPIALVAALKRLDKFYQNSLPAHMVPSSYVVVDKLPMNHNLLNQLASKIPCQVLNQVRTSLQEAWKKRLIQASLTGPENILRSFWAKILGMQADQIDVDDNFFRLGGDSVLAMKLVSSLRAQGHSLTVADIFQHMRLGDAAKRLKVGQPPQGKVKPYEPFSTLGSIDSQRFLSEIVQPKLADPTWGIQDAYPVTDTQALDVRGTTQIPRTSIQYNMLYFDNGIDRQRLFQACRDLVKTHDILRTVFVEENGSLFQVVLKQLEAPLATHLADRELDSYVYDLCAEDANSGFQLGSPFFKFIHVADDDGKECLVLGLSHALYDGMSLPKLLQDLEMLYLGKNVVGFEPFSSYVAHIRDTRVQTRSPGYWSTLLNGSSLSVLEGTSYQPGDKGVFKFKPVDSFQPLKDITTANLLTAAWAVLLARRLRNSDVTFGGVTSGRMIDLTNVENVMGPCYQLTPIRVQFQPKWTVFDLLHFVQKQSAESAAHDFLGFEKIAQQVTSWPSNQRSFDSVVHHQDFDDFDTMPFGEGSCRVEISNPHGDAPYPFKVVSFVRDGTVHVGAVGAERDSAMVVEILDDLAAIVSQLSKCYPDALLDEQLF